MSKGLKITLMTVAIALVSAQAMALAPVIKDLPDVIVGKNVGITGANSSWTPFVYPDAMDLNTLASDDYTSATGLMWTYTGSSLAYLINGVNPISLGTTDPTSPTKSQIINRTVAAAEQNTDGKANTITIRNKNLAPLGGTVTYPTTAGLQTAQLVTFFCSDGNLYSSQTVYFYTDNDGMNRLSGGSAWTAEKPSTTPTGTYKDTFTSWFWAKDKVNWSTSGGGTATTHTYNSNGGMCLDVSAAGTNVVDLVSPYQYFSLAKNKIYRLTLTMNGSQLSPGSTPLWDFIIQNTTPDGSKGYNLYAQDLMFYDNSGFGGQNTVLNTTNGAEYQVYFAPASVEAAQWNNATTGAFATANVAQVQPLCEFRILDYTGASLGYGENKSGAVCIQNLKIESADISSVTKLSSYVNITNFVQSNSSGTGNVTAHSLYATGLSTWVFSGGAITVTPNATNVSYGGKTITGQQQEAFELYPATDLVDGADATSPSYLDNYPIKWNSQELLRYQVDITATDASLVGSPWDAIMLNMQGMDSELLFESYMTSSYNLAAPLATASTTYQVFLWTHNKPYNSSNASISAYQQLRWVLRYFNSPGVYFPSWNATTSALNKSPMKLTGLRVDKVEVK